jgi:hypothetical protein
MAEPTVIVHFDEQGELNYHVQGDVRMFIVDERAPDDRVYEWTPRATPEAIGAMLGPDPDIGSSGDARHAALAARIEAAQQGRAHLHAVEGND